MIEHRGLRVPETDGSAEEQSAPQLELPDWLTRELRRNHADVRFESAPPSVRTAREPDAAMALADAARHLDGLDAGTSTHAPSFEAQNGAEESAPEPPPTPAMDLADANFVTERAYAEPDLDSAVEPSDVDPSHHEFAAGEDEADVTRAEGAATLAPQVITEEGGEDPELVLSRFERGPSAFRTRRFLSAALVGVTLVLVGRVLLHHEAGTPPLAKPAAAATTTRLLRVPSDETAITADESSAMDEPETTSSSSEGARRDPSARASESVDVPRTFGPSVARFPDLPAAILSALAKPFETDSKNDSKNE